MGLKPEERHAIKQAIDQAMRKKEKIHHGSRRMDDPLPESLARRERRLRQEARERAEKEGTLL